MMKRSMLYAGAVLMGACALVTERSAIAQDPFVGEIRMFGFSFCPRGWTEADGQLLAITSNTALFSLYGTTYGGDGRTTFGLPDLRGRVPMHVGNGPGLSSYTQGQKGGVEGVTLTTAQIPAHNHTYVMLTSGMGNVDGIPQRTGGGEQNIATSDTGGGQSHENRQPYLVMRYCVALTGVFPSRN